MKHDSYKATTSVTEDLRALQSYSLWFNGQFVVPLTCDACHVEILRSLIQAKREVFFRRPHLCDKCSGEIQP